MRGFERATNQEVELACSICWSQLGKFAMPSSCRPCAGAADGYSCSRDLSYPCPYRAHASNCVRYVCLCVGVCSRGVCVCVCVCVCVGMLRASACFRPHSPIDASRFSEPVKKDSHFDQNRNPKLPRPRPDYLDRAVFDPSARNSPANVRLLWQGGVRPPCLKISHRSPAGDRGSSKGCGNTMSGRQLLHSRLAWLSVAVCTGSSRSVNWDEERQSRKRACTTTSRCTVDEILRSIA